VSLRLALAATALLASTAGAAADWQLAVEASGLRRVQAEGEADTGGASVPATIALACHPAERGMLVWTLAVEARGLDFGFDAFEGPDAPAAGHKLARLAVEGGLLQPRFATALAGYWRDGNRFMFELAAPAQGVSDAALLADSIGTQSTRLVWEIAGHAGDARRLSARVPLSGAAAAVADAMLGCGPPPPIGAAWRARWDGRDLHAAGFFGDRAVRWRLAAIVGVDESALLASMAGATSLANEGETVYVLAPAADDPRSGAALLLAGPDAEWVRIRDGSVERSARRAGAIAIPSAVREFVAARSAARE
jgi:hypothetical protein